MKWYLIELTGFTSIQMEEGAIDYLYVNANYTMGGDGLQH